METRGDPVLPPAARKVGYAGHRRAPRLESVLEGGLCLGWLPEAGFPCPLPHPPSPGVGRGESRARTPSPPLSALLAHSNATMWGLRKHMVQDWKSRPKNKMILIFQKNHFLC